ncbi:MAG: pantoate--beta-alanine ligase [Spirochaetota bacterium]
MKVVHKIEDVRQAVFRVRSMGKKIGFVPTMGFLHSGHLSLVDIARENSSFIVMSIFVNRLQFNDQDDFKSYPKDIEQDIKVAEEAGVDLVFIPDDSEMYRNNLTHVNVDKVTLNLCGAHRPGHFEGVFTVVSKLFNIVQPHLAVFGQKDIQQAVSIEKMVLDLNFPINIIIAPTIREDDGLAKSSRNKHLSSKDRENAVAIFRSLKKAEEAIEEGERDVDKLTSIMMEEIQTGNPDSIDYVSAVSYDNLSLIEKITGKSVIAVAAFWGTTRLIDNMIIDDISGRLRCIY